MASVLGCIFKLGVIVRLVGLARAQDGDQATGEDAHEMTQGDLVVFALGSVCAGRSVRSSGSCCAKR